MIDARVRASDNTYTVVENRVDFTDIQHLSREMQDAIRVLAAQEIIQGTGGGNFSPLVTLPRDQLTVVTTRVLLNEMGYRFPANPSNYLQAFQDQNALANWSRQYIALASRENLVIRRADGTFRPTDNMNRGDVAVMLHRLYLLLW